MKLRTALFLASLLLSTPSWAQPLRIVTEEWPPFIYAEDGVIKGADKEITEHLLSQLGYEVKWKLKPWRRALRDVEQGEADAILDIAPHPSHKATLLFTSEPLSSHETVLFHARGRPFTFSNLEDLTGLVIGVSPGYLYNHHLFVTSDAFFREPAPTFEANMQKLVRGRVDLVAMSRPVGLYTSQALGIDHLVDYHPTALSHSDFFLAFHRAPRWETAADAFSEALRAFKTSAKYNQTLAKYRLENTNGKLSLAP